MKTGARYWARAQCAFTLVEVVVASAVLGIIILSLFGAFSSGISVVQAARENMRATQILVQKMETIRLLTWSQTTNVMVAPTNFSARYDPISTNSGTRYMGSYTPGPAPSDIPAAYRDKLRSIDVVVYWTNSSGRSTRVQSRQMQTFVARYGMQNYVY